MRYATMTAEQLMDWGIQEIELRQADMETHPLLTCEQRKMRRAKAIGATIQQANGRVNDAKRFLERKGIRA